MLLQSLSRWVIVLIGGASAAAYFPTCICVESTHGVCMELSTDFIGTAVNTLVLLVTIKIGSGFESKYHSSYCTLRLQPLRWLARMTKSLRMRKVWVCFFLSLGFLFLVLFLFYCVWWSCWFFSLLLSLYLVCVCEFLSALHHIDI